MRNFTIFICLILKFSVVAQHWQWAKSANGAGEINAVKTDNAGNVLVTGFFVDNITLGTTTLNSVGSNMFICKYNSTGDVIWAKSYGKLKSTSICLDETGNIYVTGAFTNSVVTVGSFTLNNAGGNNPGSAGGAGGPCSDLFLLKCDQSGNVVWARSTGGTNNELSRSVCADGNGNVFITGSFRSDSILFDSVVLTNANWGSLFIVKYNGNGTVVWAKKAEVSDGGFAVATDAAGNSFITGEFFESVTFDSITLTTPNSDVFIVKFDPVGNVVWAKNPPIGFRGGGHSLTIDPFGNLFVAGWFNGPSITFGSTVIVGNGNGSDPFLAKFDNNGNSIWAKGAYAINGGNDYCHSVSSNAEGDVFVTGHFDSESISFDSFTLLRPGGSYFPTFIVNYDTNGNVRCASLVGDGSYKQTIVSADSDGNAYFGSGFYEINPLIIGSDTLHLNSSKNIFLAKFNCDNTVGLSKIPEEESLKIFPNPSAGIFNIQYKNRSEKTIRVYDVFGNCLINDSCQSDVEQRIDLSCQPKGIYFVKILSEGQRVVQKIIVE